MYYYNKKGEKVRHNTSSSSTSSLSQVNQKVGDPPNGNGKCPSWVFIIVGVIAVLVATWLIWCLVQERKRK